MSLVQYVESNTVCGGQSLELRLPKAWQRLLPSERWSVVRYLNGDGECPLWWRNASFTDYERCVITSHLRHAYHLCGMSPKRVWPKDGLYRNLGGHACEVAPSESWRPTRDSPRYETYGAGNYVRPTDDRRRVLHHSYAGLSDYWVRANGVRIEIKNMDSQHIGHCMRLMEESYRNLCTRSCMQLGHFYRHLRHVISGPLLTAGQAIDDLQVEDVYPVYRHMAKELKRRGVNHVELEWDDR